jgi:hypothetical protein
MGQAVQTITAADKGIKAITAMIEQAKGIAQSAQSAAAGTTATQNVTAAVEASPRVFGTASVSGLLGAADGSTIILGAITFTEGVDWMNDAADATTAGNQLAQAINTEGTYTAVNNAGTVTISLAGDDVEVADITGTAVVTKAVVAAPEPAVAATVYTIGGETFTAGIEFQVEVDPADTAANLVTAIEAAGVGAASNVGAVVTVALPSAELESLQAQYNTLRTQLSALANDSGYKGKNLLAADTLAVKFEGTTLSVVGFNASAAGLGITGATWTIGGSINADINLLDTALVTLRQESSKMSGNLSIISVRQEFSTNMINTLVEGSDKLTLADANEEGANMLMLQTRQTLSTTALSLSAQAAQSVLRLFQ